MAEIFSMDGDVITRGLQGSAVCDEAIQAARHIARDRGEEVWLEDGGQCVVVCPNGEFRSPTDDEMRGYDMEQEEEEEEEPEWPIPPLCGWCDRYHSGDCPERE